MPISPIVIASESIRDEISSSYSALLNGSNAIRSHVTDRIREWELVTTSILDSGFPFLSQEEDFSNWHDRLQNPAISECDLGKAVDGYMDFCREIGYPANESFWRGQFKSKAPKTTIAQKLADDTSIGIRLLLNEWQKRMDQVRAEWELREIEARRAAFMAELKKVLRSLKGLQERLQELGLDTGLLLDLSKGNLTAQDIQQFERWAKYLAEDKGIRTLCELLGKIRQIELSEKIERVRSVTPVQAQLPDINSREEIIGIRLGRDLEHVLPSELALLADPDTAILFDLKYVESSLMCFDMNGIQNIHRHVETEEERSIKEAEKQGPMVICIDTSGSMNGTPETVAKAVALFLATKAREQKRPCYLINFSTGIYTLDLSADIGMESLLRFLGMSFHGGTDVAPALEHALDKMEEDAYKNADLLIVSDFIMSELPEYSLGRIESRRLYGNRFHSLVVGNCYMSQRLKTHFDNEWVYDPRTSRIHELVSFERNIIEKACVQ